MALLPAREPLCAGEQAGEAAGEGSTHHRDVAVLNAEDGERHYDFTSSLYFVITSLTTMGKIM